MIERQVRIRRLEAVAAEYRAARTAAELLRDQLRADPSYGDRRGWTARAGRDFQDNLEATYVVRLYAEFEATLRDYWRDCMGRETEPPMIQLLNEAIPDQHFPQDYVDAADEVRVHRNSLVHGSGRGPLALDLGQVERRLRAYVSRLRADW